MTVKHFEAGSMPEALRQVRADLGERAVILETRRVRRGLMGFLGLREQVQVKAALDHVVAVPAAPAAVDTIVTVSPRASMVASPARVVAPAASAVPSVSFQRPDLPPPGGKEPRPPRRGDIRANLAERLSGSGVEDALNRRLLEACGTELSEAALAAVIARHIPVARSTASEGRACVALVGPTGVGKTTTTAKLAARFALTERKRVALVTIDTYRIGAVEQLRTYARVMGLPLEVVQSPDEMRAAMGRHQDKDAVFIDTVGRSPRRSLQLAEIKAYLNEAEPTETHLVLSAPSGLGYLYETAEHFAALGVDRVLVTKLDEMPRWGVIASLVDRTGLPVSYITDGQDVPRNLRPARADEVALKILGGSDA